MTTELLEAFGDHLKICRKKAGLSQESLAELADLDRTYISLLERGKRNPSLVCLKAIASALKISLSLLMDFKIR